MAQDYHLFYPAVPNTRAAVLDKVIPILLASGARMLRRCYQLLFDPQEKAYRYTLQGVDFKDPNDALEKASTWPGLSLPFEYPLGDLEAILWNDEGNAEQTTLTLSETSGLFAHQNENEAAAHQFQTLAVKVAAAINAPCCILKAEAPLRSLVPSAVVDLLNDPAFHAGNRIPTFLAVRDDLVKLDRLEKVVPDRCVFKREGRFGLVADKSFGQPVSD